MFRRENSSPSRRRVLEVLAAVGSGGLAGCFSPGMGGPVPELSVYNAMDRSVSVSLEVYRVPDDNLVVTDEFTLGPDSGRDYPRPFEEDGPKRIEIAVGDGRRVSREWEGSVDPDSDGLDVTISDGGIDVSQVVA